MAPGLQIYGSLSYPHTWKQLKEEKEAAVDIEIPRSFTLGAPALPNQRHYKKQDPITMSCDSIGMRSQSWDARISEAMSLPLPGTGN